MDNINSMDRAFEKEVKKINYYDFKDIDFLIQ